MRSRTLLAVVAAIASIGLLLPAIALAEPRTLAEIQAELDATQQERELLETRIAEATAELETLRGRIAELELEREGLTERIEALRADVAELEELITFRVRESFKHGSSVDPMAVFLASDDPVGALSRVEIVTRVVGGDRARTEELVAARALVDAAEQRLAEQAAELETSRSRQAEVAEQLQEDFDAATALEASLSQEAREERDRLERERLERERREREERERLEREEQQRREREAARQAEAERQAEGARQAEAEVAAQREAEPSRSTASSASSSSTASRSSSSSSAGSASTSSGSASSGSSGSSGSSSSSGGSSSSSGGSSSSSGGSSSPSSGASSSGSSSNSSGSSSGSSSSSSGSSGSSSGGTSSSGATACPLDQPRHFTDTWGAPRSGGRSHRGTDIMGPHGIPVRAIVSGTWRIMPYGASAGYWGILHGDDGNHYWYLHLQSHTVSNGARVSAGQQIARNGATGNAPPNTPHIHFELHPGGGSAVNPYATLRRACG